MKKLLTIGIAVLYLAVSSGLALQIHHCMGEIADISLVVSDTGNCGSCGMDKQSNDCCKDELKFVKLQDIYKLSQSAYQFTLFEASVQREYILRNDCLQSRIIKNDYNNHSPPDLSHISLFLLHCVFRI